MTSLLEHSLKSDNLQYNMLGHWLDGMKEEFGHKSRMDGVQASPNNVKHATGITIQAS